MNRADKIIGCRPHIASKELKNTSDEEQFQNQVIRPILKFQNELFIKLFLSNCKTYKINFTEFNSEEKHDYINHIFKKDFKIRASFIGTIIALFTLEEFEKYSVNRQLYNKRIIQMLTERLKNQMV
tara:strand:+ start:1951 stop:2328 length:378 start_codon:yes stop_codon:yes gene_type:complete